MDHSVPTVTPVMVLTLLVAISSMMPLMVVMDMAISTVFLATTMTLQLVNAPADTEAHIVSTTPAHACHSATAATDQRLHTVSHVSQTHPAITMDSASVFQTIPHKTTVVYTADSAIHDVSAPLLALTAPAHILKTVSCAQLMHIVTAMVSVSVTSPMEALTAPPTEAHVIQHARVVQDPPQTIAMPVLLTQSLQSASQDAVTVRLDMVTSTVETTSSAVT